MGNAQGEAMQVMAAGEDGVAIVGQDEVLDSGVLRNLRIALPNTEDRLDVDAKLLAARSCNEQLSESTLRICYGLGLLETCTGTREPWHRYAGMHRLMGALALRTSAARRHPRMSFAGASARGTRRFRT